MKKQVFRLGENAFFCNSTCYVLMKLAQPARRPCNRPGFQHVMYWWIWHNLPDDLATDLHLHRTANYNQRQAFIQVNDVETKETDRTSSGHFLIDFFLTATVRVLPGTFGDLDCPGWSASTTWTHIALLTGASLNAHGLCVSRPCLHAHNGTHRDESTYLASSHER